MRRLTLTLTVLVAPFALLACGDDDGDDQTDRCTTEGDLRCNGTMIQSCEMTEDGYLDWMDSSDCADNGLSCLDTGATVECAAGCTDECDAADDTQCSGTEIETCTLGADGCLHWVAEVDCADTGEVCDDSTGDATCVAGCVDECENEGDSQCDGSVIETCALTGSGCLEWIGGYDCADGGWQCDDSGGVANCLTDCTTGPGAPTNPSPADGATDVDAGVVTVLDWDDVSGATSYDVYFGTTCPPPAYPDAGYQRTVVSEWAGVALAGSSSYCWKVVPRDDAGCLTEGPTWTFDTATLPAADPGTTCEAAVDLTNRTLPYLLPGDFTEDPTTGSSCDSSLYNAAWFRYTPSADGWYRINLFNNTLADADVDLAVFEGTACNPYGTEVFCDGSLYQSVGGLVFLSGGTTYTILAASDDSDEPMVDPIINIQQRVPDTGETCDLAIDISGVSFPYTISGTFDWGASAITSSCDSTIYNGVYVTWSPPSTGWYSVSGQLTQDTSYAANIAVYAATGCNLESAELSCDDSTTDTATMSSVYLDSATTYTFLLGADDVTDDNTDPVIDIQPLSPNPGQTCDQAVDLTGETFPYTATGTFDWDPGVSASCDSSLYNGAWFHYTPDTTGWYDISGQLTQSTFDDARVVVFEGTTCFPTGAELGCDSSTSDTAIATTYLTAGTTYTILLAGDGSADENIDSVIDIQLSSPQPTAGQTCDQAIDLTGETFPYTATGTFDWAPHTAGSCDSTIYNGAWFQFTPSTTDWYDISGQLTQSTFDDADLIVFEGSGCFPVGAELACVSASTDTAEAKVQLTAGTTYTIVLASDSSFDDNTDPIIDIAVGSPPPEGIDCSLPATTTSPNHSVDGSGHDCWTWTEDAADTTDDHTFACDSGTGGDVVVEFTTGASQTTLNWDALMYNEDSSGYIRVDVTESPCASPAGSLYCTPSTSNLSDTGNVTVSPNTTYYLWVGDGFSGNYRPAIDLCVW